MKDLGVEVLRTSPLQQEFFTSFQTHLVVPIAPVLFHRMHDILKQKRHGDTAALAEYALIPQITSMCMVLDKQVIYTDLCEKLVLEQAAEYYAVLGKQLASSSPSILPFCEQVFKKHSCLYNVGFKIHGT